MTAATEFETTPVTPDKLEPPRHFAASYAGEHVAGTEFVIGALFVSLGVSTYDIIIGLLLGNLLAVLTWALICAPIAVQTRLTLYAYLEKIAGARFIKLYSVINGILFSIIAGAMITVSASAVRIPFDIAPQVNWYPTSISFVLVVMAVGAVISYVAVCGFKKVAQFAEVCAPWMVLMFFAGAMAMLPLLIASAPDISGLSSFKDFIQVGDQYIWIKKDNGIGVWHIAAFAWVVNLPMHGALSDMTILRYAKKPSYGYFSALGMFVGHYLAWIFAGIMGAGAALIMKSSITQLDAGEVAFQALGWAGMLAVVIAGWTTSNPTIYRAGLAFQSLNPKWSRVKVTAMVGALTTVIACFPFVFSKLLDLVSFMGLVISPIGAIIVTEHWLFPKLGLTRYWTSYSGRSLNSPALLAWVGSLLVALSIHQWGLHLFFLLIPTWISAQVFYVVLARFMGAKESFPQLEAAEQHRHSQRTFEEQQFLAKETNAIRKQPKNNTKIQIARFLAIGSLVVCSLMAVWIYLVGAEGLETFRRWLTVPTVIYFISATIWMLEKEHEETEAIDSLSERPA
jgi:NCS1 family nucleobase:cation symporter-1